MPSENGVRFSDDPDRAGGALGESAAGVAELRLLHLDDGPEA